MTVTTFSFNNPAAVVVRTAAEGSKDDDAMVLAVAKVLGADPVEVRKKRDENPQWFADVVAKYGLSDGGKG